MSGLRKIAAPFVAAAPTGATVRTRVRASSQDARVQAAVGGHLGALASADLAARVREGCLDPAGRAASRRVRKQRIEHRTPRRIQRVHAVARFDPDLDGLIAVVKSGRLDCWSARRFV